jgi:hypothetical protein
MAPAIGDHPLMERSDAVATGVLKGKWKERMQETRDGPEQHADSEAARRTQVLQVALADRSRVLCKEMAYSHGSSLGEPP